MPNAAEDARLIALTAENAALKERLAAAEARTADLGVSDTVTGLYSARYFEIRLGEEVARADRFGLALGCAIVRLDRSDLEGLLDLAEQLRAVSRLYDVSARLGAHELALLLPSTEADGVRVLAERLLSACRPKSPVSIGLAAYPLPGIETPQALVEAARRACETAAAQGGDRFVVAERGR